MTSKITTYLNANTEMLRVLKRHLESLTRHHQDVQICSLKMIKNFIIILRCEGEKKNLYAIFAPLLENSPESCELHCECPSRIVYREASIDYQLR